jgi:hypothetical protein
MKTKYFIGMLIIVFMLTGCATIRGPDKESHRFVEFPIIGVVAVPQHFPDLSAIPPSFFPLSYTVGCIHFPYPSEKCQDDSYELIFYDSGENVQVIVAMEYKCGVAKFWIYDDYNLPQPVSTKEAVDLIYYYFDLEKEKSEEKT